MKTIVRILTVGISITLMLISLDNVFAPLEGFLEWAGFIVTYFVLAATIGAFWIWLFNTEGTEDKEETNEQLGELK